jgi:hypothetical protein
MGQYWNAYDREVEYLERQLADGEITHKQFQQAMRDLNEDMRAAEEEAVERFREDWRG